MADQPAGGQYTAVVLGCGLVGATMARELSRSGGCAVTAADLSPQRLDRLAADGIRTRVADLGRPETLAEVVRDYDVVLGALPSRFGFQTLRTVIEAGRPYCDISFMPENALDLDARARETGVTAIVDCGVSPGLSNMMVGFAHAQLGSIDDAEIFVGGLPKVRRWPYEYKAPFAPADVIEEYTRPARLVENGRVVVKEALSEPQLLDLPGVGTLEGFNTDGLRSLLTTVKARNMREKTLRYPGHAALMRVLRETGFFDRDPISVGDQTVRPIDVTSELLFPRWTYDEGEEEFTILRVVVEGSDSATDPPSAGPADINAGGGGTRRHSRHATPLAEGWAGGARRRYTFDLYDETDPQWGESSMARTTGFPCVIAARMILEGRWTEAGVFPPERLAAMPGVFEHFAEELRARGVRMNWEAEACDG